MTGHELLVDGRPVAQVELAFTARTRRKGLLGRDGLDGALWLRPCRHVHAIGMRFGLEVAHVTKGGVVVAVEGLPRWRVGRFRRGTHSIIEAELGRFADWGLVPGVQVGYRPV